MEEKNAALNERIDIAKIGRRIMAMRLANGMTRAELAEKVEKSNQTLASIEYGHKGMSLQTLCSICDALEVTPNYILGWSRYPIEQRRIFSGMRGNIGNAQGLQPKSDENHKQYSQIVCRRYKERTIYRQKGMSDYLS